MSSPIRTLEAGDVIYHVFNHDRSLATDFNPVLSSVGEPDIGARFSALRYPPEHESFQPYSSYYFAWLQTVAIWEAVIRDNLRPHPGVPERRLLDKSLLAQRSIATLIVAEQMDLADLCGRDNQEHYGVDRHVLRGRDYDKTRAIANRLRRLEGEETCGLVWMSAQDDAAQSGMLVGRPFAPDNMVAGEESYYQYPPALSGGNVATAVLDWADGRFLEIDTHKLLSKEGWRLVNLTLPEDSVVL